MSTFQREQVQDIYYLSPMQEGMLFHTVLHPEESFYVDQMVIQVKGSFRTDWLEQSVNEIVDRHDVFRTVFVYEKVKRSVQVVLNERVLKVQEIDVSGLSSEEQAQRIDDYKQQDKDRGFDLSSETPMRMVVFKRGEDVYEWIWTYHHILLDGWCLGIVIQELFQVYDAVREGKSHDLPSSKPYKEYINWLERQDKEQSLQYWADYLSGFEGQTTFAEQRKRRGQQGNLSEEINFRLETQESKLLSELAQAQRVTLSTALQAAWSILLSRYQRTNDVIFGTIVSGRPAEISGMENMVGLFINVVPTRVRLSEDSSFAQVISELQRQSVESEAHQYVPIYDIQSDAAQHDLIDHIVVFENYPLQEVNKEQEGQEFGFTVGEVSIFEKTNYDLNLIAFPGNELLMKIVYNSNAYDRSFVLRLTEELIEIIRQIVTHPDMPISDIQVVPQAERHLLFAEFNPVQSEEPNPFTLAQWFERQVEKTPDHVALVAEDKTFTYSELNAHANQLARLLRVKGVMSETVVAMLVQRSPEMIIGILGILKAGGAYLPIDPEYPEARIRYMLEDSGSQLVLTQHFLTDLVSAACFHGESVLIDNPALYQGAAENVEFGGSPEHLVYVMYTSGSTGKPKGNLTSHSNVSRVVKNTNYIEITDNDTVLSLSNYAFDGFTFDLFGALLNGARLVLAPKETILHIGKLVQLMEDERITVVFVTTALFNLLVDAGTEWMKGIRKVLFGGERSSVNHVRTALHGMGPGKMIHVYGPTETTVFATFFPVNEVLEDVATIPIGRPLNDTSIFILGPTNQLQPIDAIGELCVGGTGLARGYLNRPDLTAEKFVPHPFAAGQRVYRTGDLARWLPDGTVEFMGRMDDQVKIRGHRIELGEIEKQLVQHSSVKEAVVLARRNDSETSLCAYVVCQPGEELSNEGLRSHLAKALPLYMVPPAYVLLDRLPLTTNGKVDRRLLPKAPQEMKGFGEVTPPRNEIESKLVTMWSEVLGGKDIGIHDDFFALGGHSLKMMALCSQMLKEFHFDVPIGLMFESPTIAGVSAYLQTHMADRDGDCVKETVDSVPSHQQQEVTSLNLEGSQNLFAFPPVLGYGVMFKDLAKQLPGYRVHAFDFIEEEDRIRRYLSRMLSIQPQGSFTILGYSAGCSLAFEVARALEELGEKVDVMIMVDSYKKNRYSSLDGRSVEEDVDALLKANEENIKLESESIRQGISQKMTSYYAYYVELINKGQVHAPLHLIKSETELTLPPELSSWEEATTGIYLEHQGYGKHEEMLQASFAKVNAKIIEGILLGITVTPAQNPTNATSQTRSSS